MGTGAFTAQTLQNNQLTIVLPSATSQYGVAWHCIVSAVTTSDFVLKATPQDGTAYTVGCPNGFSQTAAPSGLVAVTGSVDASAIAGVNIVDVTGKQGENIVFAPSGSFSVSLASGTNDVAFVPMGPSSPNPPVINVAKAVKILRNQAIPGTINGGNTVTFSPADMVTNETLTVSNIPAGFINPPAVRVNFQTANGTVFALANEATTQYPALPAAALQTGDSYLFSTQTASMPQTLAILQSSTSGGPVTLALPQPWSYSGPAPAAFPTFTFNYSGFNGLPVITQSAVIFRTVVDAGEPFFRSIEVLATGSYQNGANTITVPDLTAIPGFISPALSGTTVSWSASIAGGSAPEVQFVPSLPANGSVAIVSTSGSYTVP